MNVFQIESTSSLPVQYIVLILFGIMYFKNESINKFIDNLRKMLCNMFSNPMTLADKILGPCKTKPEVYKYICVNRKIDSTLSHIKDSDLEPE